MKNSSSILLTTLFLFGKIARMVTSGRQRLAEYRDRLHLKQYELADMLGFTQAYLSQLLSGRRSPGRTNSLKIEEVTGIPVRSWSDNGDAAVTRRGRASADKSKVHKAIRQTRAS